MRQAPSITALASRQSASLLSQSCSYGGKCGGGNLSTLRAAPRHGHWLRQPKKDDLLWRLEDVKEDFLQAELAELDIRPAWQQHKKICLETARTVAGRIPKLTP
jgi:hypothetical protein